MSEITAWALVASSFLVLGFFGYASVIRSKAVMACGAVVSGFVLNGIASQIFTTVEITKIKESGIFQEHQMQPDMPNLMGGLIMFGWVFFLGGFFAGKLRHRIETRPNSEQVRDANLLSATQPPGNVSHLSGDITSNER